MPVGAAIGLGAAATVYSANKAEDSAYAEGKRLDSLEAEKLQLAREQAQMLREQGDEAAAVAVEEGIKAELGASRYETITQTLAQREADFARRNEQIGLGLYKKARDAGKARQAAGEAGADRIMDASGRLMKEAGRTEDRFSPFMKSERDSLRQMQIEMGMRPGEVNRSYRENNPAYQEYMEASRVAEEDAARRIDQAAGNQGTLYSGSRGAALMDRYKRGDFERAGIEQSYYQMYMDKLQQMANPNATKYVSDTSMNAAGTGINAAQAAESMRVNSMLTGREGLEVLPLMRTGTEGRDTLLSGFDYGTAGTPYRMMGEDYKFKAAGGAGGMVIPAAPTGLPGANARFAGVEARSAGMADLIGGGVNLYTAYMNRPQTPPPPTDYYSMGGMPSWGYS